MIGNATMLSLMLLLFTGTFASADSFDDCRNDCTKVMNQCIEGITLYDEAGVREARAACTRDVNICGNTCHDVDELGTEGYQEKLKREADEAAERKRQEQEQENNGGVKTYNADQ